MSLAHETLRIGRRDALWNEVLIKTLEKGYVVFLPLKYWELDVRDRGSENNTKSWRWGGWNCLLVALAVISLGELSESFSSLWD